MKSEQYSGRKRQTRHLECGLSLVELCAVIAVIGIVSVAGVNTYRSSALAGATKYEASQLSLEMEAATNLALSMKTPLYAEIRGDEVYLLRNSSETVRVFSLDSRLQYDWKFAAVTSGIGTIGFYPSGVVTPGRVTISSSYGHRCIVTQSLRGRRGSECLL